jgi:hypothetical protein
VLFGANSAGKSTLLQAMLYLRELLERRNADADQLQASGSSIDLGGFRQLVHGHDLDREVKIGVEVDVSDDGLPVLAVPEMAQVHSVHRDFIENGVVGVERVGVEVSVGWNAREEAPLIRALSVQVNGHQFAKIEAESAQQCYLAECNLGDERLPETLRGTSEPEDDTGFAWLLSSFFARESLLRTDSFDELSSGTMRVPLTTSSVVPSWGVHILQKEDFSHLKLGGAKRECRCRRVS